VRTAQTIAERHAALESLLPLLHAHHAYLDQVRSGLGGLAPSPPEGPPSPNDEDREEPWVTQERLLARAYRLDEVARLFALLEEVRPRWALAVYYEHIEPWPAWEPGERSMLARLGVRFMAASCRGWLPTFAPALLKRRPVAERLPEVGDLRGRGWSRDRIAKRLHMSPRDVSETISKLQEQDTLNVKSTDKNALTP
jgi:hypothetical protein